MLFGVAFPMLLSYMAYLWSLDAYGYFPFVLLAVGWMIAARWDRVVRPPVGFLGWLTIAVGVCFTILAVLIPSPWLAAFGFVLFCFSFCCACRDQDGLSLVGVSVPLMMLLKLPLGLDQVLVVRLQQITTSLSSVTLDLMAVPHAIENNVIRLASRDLFVAEACSGIQSVFTLMFLSTLLVAVFRRLIWLTPIYLAIAIFLAVFANVVRVTAVAVGDVWFGIDLAEGWQHEVVGYAALLIGCLFLISFDQLLVSVLHPIHESPGHSSELNPVIRAWNFLVGGDSTDDQIVSPIVWLVSQARTRGIGIWRMVWPIRAMMCLFLVLMLASMGQAIHTFRPIKTLVGSTDLIYVPSPDVFDSVAGVVVTQHEIIRDGSDPNLMEYNDLFTCRLRDNDLDSQFVISQPYVGWHELCWCYTAKNWTLLSRIIRSELPEDATIAASSEDSTNSLTCPYVLAKFRINETDFAYLFYSAIDRSANLVEPPMQIGRLQGRFAHYLQAESITISDLAMIQMLVFADHRLSRDELDLASAEFLAMRRAALTEAKNQRKGDQNSASSGTKDFASELDRQDKGAVE